MKKIIQLFRKDLMLSVSLLAALLSLGITPPSRALLSSIDWHTLGMLFMMLTVLEGFKKDNIFLPVIRSFRKTRQDSRMAIKFPSPVMMLLLIQQ